MQTVFTPWRLRVYPRLLLAAMAVALLFAFSSGSGAGLVSGRLGGDFAEFYAAGRIVRSGQGAQLYETATQRAAQAGLMPGTPDAYVPFVYPAQFALPYALLAALPYRAAFAVHLALMAGLLYAALLLVCRERPWARPYVPAVFCATALFYPMLRALLGGQNTPLTLALLVFAWVLERRGRDSLSGVCLAILCYKPQFGLPLLGLYFLAGRMRLAVSGLVALGLILAADAWVFGLPWMAAWLAHANGVVATSLSMEGDKAVSFLGVCRHVLAKAPDTGLILGLGLSLVTAAVLGWSFWQRRGRPVSLAHLGLAASGLVLLAPHAYFYDAGLLVLPALALLDQGRPQAPGLVLSLWLLGLGQLAAGPIGLSPLFLAALAAFGLAAGKLARPDAKDSQPVSRCR